MEKMYQVFLSSTFVDLKDERKAVSNMLAKAGYMVAGMELFPATDQQQFEYIKTIIDRSDYYVVILAARYGSATADGISYTEAEYDYARSKGIPVLGFIHNDPGSIAADRTDRDPAKEAKLDAFRAKLMTGRMVEKWTDTGTLCAQVVIAVGNEKTLRPGVGWIRGDQAADPKVMQDVARLTLENSDLREKLRASESEGISFDPALVGPDDSLEFPIDQTNSDGKLIRQFTVSIPIGTLFINLYDALLEGPREHTMDQRIGAMAAAMSGYPTEEISRADASSVTRFRDQLEALGLLMPESRVLGGMRSGATLIWNLTNKGRRYAAMVRALRRTTTA